MSRKQAIINKIKQAIPDAVIELKDDSEKHRGHAGYQEGGESHFRLTVISNAFEGVGRVARQRQINDLLAELFADGLHALSVKALTIQENGELK